MKKVVRFNYILLVLGIVILLFYVNSMFGFPLDFKYIGVIPIIFFFASTPLFCISLFSLFELFSKSREKESNIRRVDKIIAVINTLMFLFYTVVVLYYIMSTPQF